MVPALHSGCYELTWEKCADMPSQMYAASAVLHKEKVYVMAGSAPQRETYDHVFSYNITINEWSKLPPHDNCMGRLQIINDELTVIGGWHRASNKPTNNVSVFNNNTNSWTNKYPNMIKARSKPGVITHKDHVIVLGGGIDDNTDNDDIEMLNWTQPHQWMISNIKLPEPMWDISLTISDDQLLIIGYSRSDARYSKAYQLAVDSITSINQPPTSGHSVNWNKLPSAPCYNTALISHSYPPVIIGGNIQGVPISDVAILDITKKTWHRVSSLSAARNNVAVVPISHESVLVIGGTKGGKGIAANKASSVTTVEKGTVTLSHTQWLQYLHKTIQ